MKRVSFLCAAAVSALFADNMPEDMSSVRDSWAGLPARLAVVNPVSRESEPQDPNVISLRGEWEFVSRPFRNGRLSIGAYLPTGRGWERLGADAVRKMNVPGAWEAQGLGESGMSRGWVCRWDCAMRPIRNAFQGEGWYRREVQIPAAWKGRRIWLKTGMISGYGYLWINGRQVGHVDLYCGTVKYDVTGFVKCGEKAMVVAQAVNTGTSRSGAICGMNCWGGFLRDIELESTPVVHIDDAWVRGDFDRREAEVHVQVDGTGPAGHPEGVLIRATVEGVCVECPPKTGDNVLRVPLGDFRPWSPVTPNLYWAKIELLENGVVTMTRRERFGVRKLEVVKDRFYLNGRPFFVRGCGWHSHYHIHGAVPADREIFRRLARKIRASGFNACRFHTSARPQELFEAADEVGLLLEPELPYYGDTPTTGQIFDPLGDARELYLTFRRHPSFAFYSGGNEGWFGPNLSRRLYEEIKKRDPDRLMIGQDGWNNKETNQRGFSDFQGGPMNVWPRGAFKPDMPFVAHEYLNLTIKLDSRTEPKFTGAVLPPATRAGRAEWLAKFGLDLQSGDLLQDAQSVLQKTWFKYGIESARLDPECDGYSYWSLQDAGGKNGAAYSGQALFDPFMDEKPAGMKVGEVAVFNSESCLLMDTDPRLYGPEEETARFNRNPFEMFLTDFATNRVRVSGGVIDARFYLAHFGEKDIDASAVTWRLVSGGKELASGRKDTAALQVGSLREIAHCPIAVPEVDKPCRAVLHAEISTPEGVVRNSWDWWIFPRHRLLPGEGVYVTESLRKRLAPRFDALAASPEQAAVVIGTTNDLHVVEAVARGKNVITLSGYEGPVNIRLGWWWMGEQMGAVFADHPALAGLPHDGVLTPLMFRIMKNGVELTPETSRNDLIVYGEGGSACYRYLYERAHPSGAVEMAVTGMDLLSAYPESDAVLGGLVEYLRGKGK